MFRCALLISILPCSAIAADLTFLGTLEQLQQESIAIRLADGRSIDARLPSTGALSAAKIAERYHAADHVEISCKQIDPHFDEAIGRPQFLELTKLRFILAASKEELISAARLPAWREPRNLLRPPDVSLVLPEARMHLSKPLTVAEIDSQAKLERAREINLEYAAHLPNFVADETGTRYTGNDRSDNWRFLDKIETEITVKGNLSNRQRIRRDGRPWTQPYQMLPGFKWSGGFGTEIRPLFDLNCPTTIEYQGPARVRGRQVLEFHFSSPPDGCSVPFTNEYQRYNPARKGRIFIEDFTGDRGGNIIQLEEEAIDFPAQFGFRHRIETVTWDYVNIGDAQHLLPVAASFLVGYSSRQRIRVDIEFKNHRHFESSTNITFH